MVVEHRLFAKAPFPVVEKDVRAVADGVDDQVEIPVPVEVRESCPRRGQSGASDPGFRRDLLEPPVAQVPVKRVRAIQRAEVKVTPAIAIDVTRGDARPVQQNLISQGTRLRQNIGESDPGG